jgi:hypothetical protein
VENDPANHNDPLGLFLPGDYSPFDFGDFSFGTAWWYLYNSMSAYGLSSGYYWQSQTGATGGAGAAPPPTQATTTVVVNDMEFINPSNRGLLQGTITSLLRFIQGNIDEDCEKWLLGSDSGCFQLSDYINELERGSAIGHAQINDLANPNTVVNAVTGAGAGGFSIIVNTNGSVFSANAPRSAGSQFNSQISSINPGSERQGLFTLLHEFAHSLSAPGFRADRGNRNNGLLNNDDVWRNCSRTILRGRN